MLDVQILNQHFILKISCFCDVFSFLDVTGFYLPMFLLSKTFLKNLSLCLFTDIGLYFFLMMRLSGFTIKVILVLLNEFGNAGLRLVLLLS